MQCPHLVSITQIDLILDYPLFSESFGSNGRQEETPFQRRLLEKIVRLENLMEHLIEQNLSLEHRLTASIERGSDETREAVLIGNGSSCLTGSSAVRMDVKIVLIDYRCIMLRL